MYSIGQLALKYGLSRGTLLFYDSKGLLKPSERTPANYRCYSEADAERLRRICVYRETGLPLEEIKLMLDSRANETDLILEKHLSDLNQAVQRLQIQRRIILNMMKRGETSESKPHPVKDRFVLVLNHAGIRSDEQEKLHVEFERLFPDDHQAFLESLGIPPHEIKRVRDHAKRQNKG